MLVIKLIFAVASFGLYWTILGIFELGNATAALVGFICVSIAVFLATSDASKAPFASAKLDPHLDAGSADANAVEGRTGRRNE